MNKPLWYLASPYSKFDLGTEAAFREASKAAGALLKRGIFVFSPVAHSHPIAQYGEIDHLDHGIWMPLDIAILDECDGLIVLMMPGWKESRGVGEEIARATELNKPITYLSWPTLNERENEGSRDLQ